MLYDHNQYFIPKINSVGRKIFKGFLFKNEYSKLINYLGCIFQTYQGTIIWNVWSLKFWKMKHLNSDVWILKFEIWNVYVKCLEFEILNTKMSELGCVNTSSWKLQIEMSEFGCVNIKSWKLKTKIWNLFVNCLEGIWNFEKLECLNIKNWNWNLKCLNMENWKKRMCE
jgi:hypothetical protein